MLYFYRMISRRAALPILFAAVLTACSPSPKRHSDADIAFLASDANVVIGDVPLVIPFVALTGFVAAKPSFSFDRQRERQAAEERLEAFRKAASSQETAPAIDKLEVTMRTCGWDDFDMSVIRICSRLTRQWSRSVCDDPWAPLQQAMPTGHNQFFLVDVRKLDAFQNHWTVGGERVSDQLNEMRLKRGEASVVCDTKPSSKTTFCTAAVAIKQHLAAVWTVWDDPKETYSRQAKREGDAITAFVLNALGSVENFPTLMSAACGLKKPGAPTGPDGDRCHTPAIPHP
jgi:hypothetical protein